MPTYAATERFLRDFDSLTEQQRGQFRRARWRFVDDLRLQRCRSGLRVKAYQGMKGWFEMSWAPDGRALFSYGAPVIPGEPHVIWQRIGTHDIFRDA